MKRDIFFIIVLILITVIGAYFIGAKEKEKEYTGEFKTYTVIPGDTLWSIASDIESDLDIREVIHTIKKDNGLTESCLNVGQELKLRTNY